MRLGRFSYCLCVQVLSDIERELATKLTTNCNFCCPAPKGAHITLMLLYRLSMLARKHNSLNYFLLVLEHYSIIFI